jgi:hypothetical protein
MVLRSTKASSQRQRILDHLRNHGPLTTLAARRELDVMHPAARVQELRARGYRIITDAARCGHWAGCSSRRAIRSADARAARLI